MKTYLIFFLYIMSFTTGILSLTTTTVLFISKKKRFYLYYTSFFLSLVLIIFSNIVDIYIKSNTLTIHPLLLQILSFILITGFKTLGNITLLIVLPHFIYGLINKEITKSIKIFFYFLYILVFSLTTSYFITQKEIIFNMIQILLILQIIYHSFVIFKNAGSITNIRTKSVVYLLLTLTILLGPFIFVEYYFDWPRFSLAIFILIFNGFFIIHSDIIKENKAYHISKNLSRDFIDHFNITNKEAQVIQLIIQGISNKEISNQLFASIKTIENHISNIYRKLSIKNRYQLISLIVTNSD